MRNEQGVTPGSYRLNNERTLHVWLGGTEDEPLLWACSVYDHGPMCRLCQEVDGMLNACLVNVLDGRMECDQDANGNFHFKVTPAGADALKAMIKRAAGDES